MNAVCFSRYTLRLGCVMALLISAAGISQAQTSSRSVRPVPQPAAPSVAPGVASPGTPSPAGLPSPMPNPAGLTSQFPAGLPSPLPNPAGLPSPTIPNLASPGTAAGSPPVDSAVPQTSVLGAAGYGGGARQATMVAPAGPYTALQIAQSFLAADANRDGELTRAEAQHLTIMPYTFEEMDSDHDGILTRSEYEDAFR